MKPSMFKNELLATSDPIYAWVFQGLWCIADREGRMEDRPRRIHLEVNAGRAYESTEAALTWLSDNGFILRYEHGNSRYIQVVNFGKHQNPHIREPQSSIPAPDKHCASTVQAPDEHQSGPALSPFPLPDSPSLIPPSSSSKTRKSIARAEDSETIDSGPFARFWSAYPKKRARKTASEVWKRKRLDDRLAELLADVEERQRSDRRWLEGYIPDPTTYLNQERWTDEREPPKENSKWL